MGSPTMPSQPITATSVWLWEPVAIATRDAALEKIGRLYPSVRRLQALPKIESNWREVGAEESVISLGQRCKKAIAQPGTD